MLTYAGRGWRCARIAACGVMGVCAVAPAAGPMYSELISGDLPDLPAAALPPNIIATPGCTWVATGFVGINSTDVDFITIVVPFSTNRLLIDLDTNFNHQDSVLGVGGFLQYPSNPLLVNDDDLNSLDDALCGHASVSTDSLVDITAVLGSPLPANSKFTIAIGRTGEQLVGWNGTANPNMKLEYQLYVYTEVVPAPGAGACVALGIAAIRSRRRRR